ncbi:MAG: type II toxin-antitoxin system VapC family toxin [Cyclobacteriaceae bacterium]|nr:type II toxin-antitoxin system VapC family toxin [Cyclobacteriaceae bacterium]MCH8517531.1 type II toxin-antitoxin system VapC family toxin [Cyclobacteriaceae bacterium]
MSGNSIFIDTNIVLYLLSGNQTIADFLHEKTIFLSFITELELLGYKEISDEEVLKVENLLADSTIVDINSEIKKLVIELRKSNTIKLPDAIIAATSHYLNIPLMTSDTGFTKLIDLNILFYEK